MTADGGPADPQPGGRLQAWLLRDRSASRRRGPRLIVAFLVVVLGLFVAAYVVDRHRISGPVGVARGWVAAGASGDCERYLALETPDAREADLTAGVPAAFEAEPATVTDPRERLCRTLVQRFGRLEVQSVTAVADTDDENPEALLTTAAGTIEIGLQRQDGDWRVADAALRTCSLGPADPVPALPRCLPAADRPDVPVARP